MCIIKRATDTFSFSCGKTGKKVIASCVKYTYTGLLNVQAESIVWEVKLFRDNTLKKVVEHIPDNEEKAQVLKEFSKWKRSRAAQQYWANRENAQNNDRINDNNGNSSTEATGVTSTSPVRYSSTSTSCSSSSNNNVEIISVDEAKDLIRGNYTNSTNSTNSNYSDLQQSFFNFKIDTFNHVTESKLLSFESNLQQLLALSNILLIGKNTYDSELDKYFTSTSIDTIRKNVLDSLKFNHFIASCA
ncbi:hypothetical protein PS15m_003741 [Mucor circinelloides]